MHADTHTYALIHCKHYRSQHLIIKVFYCVIASFMKFLVSVRCAKAIRTCRNPCYGHSHSMATDSVFPASSLYLVCISFKPKIVPQISGSFAENGRYMGSCGEVPHAH